MIEVVNARRYFGVPLAEHIRRGIVPELARRAGIQLPSLEDVADAPVLKARVCHNRWIADCPTCGGAEFVWPDTPLFVCLSCFNGAFGGKWLRVELPKTAATIERILKARPDPRTRNWTAGETLTKLRAENREHGLAEEVG